jgi:hypothetical protein
MKMPVVDRMATENGEIAIFFYFQLLRKRPILKLFKP